MLECVRIFLVSYRLLAYFIGNHPYAARDESFFSRHDINVLKHQKRAEKISELVCSCL